MIDWPTLLLTIAIIGGSAAIGLLKPVLALTITPQDDLTRIKAHLEGPAGEAGPNMSVVGTRRSGIGPGSRRGGIARAYVVTLQRVDGTTVQRRVLIDVALFDEGAMVLEPIRRDLW